VEVAGRYSTDRSGPKRSPNKIIPRFGPQAIKNVIADYESGASTNQLADQYRHRPDRRESDPSAERHPS